MTPMSKTGCRVYCHFRALVKPYARRSAFQCPCLKISAPVWPPSNPNTSQDALEHRAREGRYNLSLNIAPRIAASASTRRHCANPGSPSLRASTQTPCTCQRQLPAVLTRGRHASASRALRARPTGPPGAAQWLLPSALCGTAPGRSDGLLQPLIRF